MLKFDNYQVYFKHYEDEVGFSTSPRGDQIPFYGRTICIIEENGEAIRDGEAFCGVNESKFNKVVGRKLALSRALEGADKEFRTKVWSEYIKATKHL